MYLIIPRKREKRTGKPNNVDHRRNKLSKIDRHITMQTEEQTDKRGDKKMDREKQTGR